MGAWVLINAPWYNARFCGEPIAAEDRELSRENERILREIRILKEERDMQSQAPHSFVSQRP